MKKPLFIVLLIFACALFLYVLFAIISHPNLNNRNGEEIHVENPLYVDDEVINVTPHHDEDDDGGNIGITPRGKVGIEVSPGLYINSSGGLELGIGL
jgi:hypothetical protein